MKFFLFAILALTTNVCYSNEWVGYVPVQPQVIMPLEPAVTYSTYTQPIVQYRWFPQTVQQPVVIYKKCFFVTKQYVEYVPIIQWVYLPVIIK